MNMLSERISKKAFYDHGSSSAPGFRIHLEGLEGLCASLSAHDVSGAYDLHFGGRLISSSLLDKKSRCNRGAEVAQGENEDKKCQASDDLAHGRDAALISEHVFDNSGEEEMMVQI